jgi:hypothetical protein
MLLALASTVTLGSESWGTHQRLSTIHEDIVVDFRFEVLTPMAMKSMVLWAVTPYSSQNARRLGEIYHPHLQLACNLFLLVPFLAYYSTLK